MSMIIVMLHMENTETGSQESDISSQSCRLCCVIWKRKRLCDGGGSEGGVFVVIALTCSCDGTLSVSGLRIRPGCQPTRTHKHAHTYCYLYSVNLYNSTPLLAAEPV